MYLREYWIGQHWAFCAFYLQKRPSSGFTGKPIQNTGAALLALSAPSYGLKLRDQPRLSHPPVAFGGVYRNFENRGRFLDAQSAEVTKFHYAAFAGVDSSSSSSARSSASSSTPRS